jgi:hypothetical protein
VSIPSIYKSPGDLQIIVDQQTSEAVCIVGCSLLLYLTENIEYIPSYTCLMLRINTIYGQLADEANCRVVYSNYFGFRP